jgi:hypothetical protein
MAPAITADLWPTTGALIGTALFLDALELSFAQILWVFKTLRFWLYFVLHLGLCALTAFLLRDKVPSWFLLAPLSAFLAMAVVSNTDIKLAGQSLLPIATLFSDIKSKMFEQAAKNKADMLERAELIERLLRIDISVIREKHTAGLMAAGRSAEHVQAAADKAQRNAKSTQAEKLVLIEQLLKANFDYAKTI